MAEQNTAVVHVNPHPDAEGFKEKVTPKKPDDDLFLFTCACGGIHYRHAGYVKALIPFIEQGGQKKIVTDNHQVLVCVACKNCYVWAGSQMYDVTDRIDLKAWEKAEVELQAATGPGGEC